MKITIEGTATELKEFYGDKHFLNKTFEFKEVEKTECQHNIVESSEDEDDALKQSTPTESGLFKEKGRITLRYGGKEITIADKNCGGDDKLFTRDEAVKHYKRLKSMHLPTIEEWSELLKLWCEWKGYKYRTSDEGLVYVRDIDDNDDKEIGKEFAEDFKLPLAGLRYYSNASVYYQGSYGYYWSSSPYSAGSTYARRLYLNSSLVYAYYDRRANGFSVRCFKNSYGS